MGDKNEPAEHTKNARESTREKHENRSEPIKEKKRQHESWVQKGSKKK